jgi:opacity protein-like surface antigen
MRACPFLLVLAVLALAPLTARLAAQDAQAAADDAIDPDRPDFTEGTGVIPLGRVQVETGYTYSRVEDEGTSALGEILVRVPFSKRAEARIGVGSYDWIGRAGPNGEGYEDPELGMKVVLTGSSDDRPKGLAHPEVALLFLTTVPVGGHDLTADAWQPTAKLALGWDLTKRFSLSSNLNLAYLADGSRRFSQVAVSLSAGYSLAERLDSFFEVFAFSRETAGGPSTRYADTGVAYAVTDNLKLDLRVGFGRNDAHPDYFVGTGAGIRW